MPTKSPQQPVKVVTYGRCDYTTRSNRRCRSLLLDPDARFCPRHAERQGTPDDHVLALFNRAHRFRCAHGINNALTDLYAHLAAGVISPSRASTLAYISSLLLRTLPAIEKEPSFACCRPIHPRNPPASTDEPTETQPAAVPSPAVPIAATHPSADPIPLLFPYRTRRFAPPTAHSGSSAVTPSAAPLASPPILESAVGPVELQQPPVAAHDAPSELLPAVEAAGVNADCTVLSPPSESGGAELETAKPSRPPFISMAKPALRYQRYGKCEIDPPGSSNASGPEENRANSS